MNNTTITKYVRDWFERGNDDLRACEILMKENGTPNTICFHAQQAAEKYLKGFLAYNEKHIRKIHDVEALLENCMTISPSFEKLRGDARLLAQFYTGSRYPDDYREFRRKEAEEAYEAAKRVKEFVVSKVK